MRIRILIIPLLLCCIACNTDREKSDKEDKGVKVDSTFDKAKWRYMEGSNYPYRGQMLNDIVYNDTVRTLTEDEILDLLGEPDKINDGHLYYEIARKKMGLWTLHTRTMVIKISDNNTIEWIKIHE